MSDPTNAPYDKLTVIHDAVEIILINMIWIFMFGMMLTFIAWMIGSDKDISGLTFGYGLLIIFLNIATIGKKWKSISQTGPENKKHELL